MNPFEQLERTKLYSRRSQSSWQEQWQLESELKRVAAWIGVAEGNVERLTKTVAHLRERTAQLAPIFPGNLGEACRELEDEQRRLSVLKEERGRLQSRIKRLERPTEKHAAERYEQQIQLGRLAGLRLEKDREIEVVVDRLLRLLQGREALSAKMQTAAAAIGLSGRPDFLDEKRFADLLASLPDDLMPKSVQWAEWFAGQEQGKKPYVVSKDTLALEETLADCHCLQRGDKVYLTDKKASELLASCSVDYLPGMRPQKKNPFVVRSETLTLEEMRYRRGDRVFLTEEQAAGLLASRSVDYPLGMRPERQEAMPNMALKRVVVSGVTT